MSEGTELRFLFDLAYSFRRTVTELIDGFGEVDGYDERYWWQAYRAIVPRDDPWTVAAWQIYNAHLDHFNEKAARKLTVDQCYPRWNDERTKRADERRRQHKIAMEQLATELRAKHRKEQLDKGKQR